MTSIAYALGQSGLGGQDGGGGFTAIVPLLLMFGIFYFLLIRPQQKKAKQHQEMISSLKKGDPVVTNGGIHGRITALDDTTITVEIADKVRVKVSRGNIAALNRPAKQPEKKEKS